jgi:hypothetical protein
MPAAPRNPKNKGTKVAHAILGKPQNMIVQESPKERRIKRRLAQEDTALVR